MNLEDYISTDLPSIYIEDSIDAARQKTLNQNASHFPIIENGKLYGSIAESDLNTFEDKSKKIADYKYTFELFFATDEDSLLDVLTLFSLHETNILPVLNKDKKYVGFYDLTDVLSLYAETPFLKEEGAVLVLEKDNNSYSTSEVTQISETNNAKVFGFFISKKTEKTTQITLKIKTDNINEIIQSYRRFEYNIISNHEDDSYLEDLKNRSNYLQKYLSI